jgi:FkbM family methyltransferase
MKNIFKNLSFPLFRKKKPVCDKNEQLDAQQDEHHLLMMPRYSKTTVVNEGTPLSVPDATSYYYARKEIFENEIYKFSAANKTPRIIDCGANIGLSVLYFKKIYPEARITAFEADPKIFSYLKRNVAASGHQDISLIQKAISNRNGEALFVSEGADAGRLIMEFDTTLDGIRIPCGTLDEVLDGEVDFLKIDIEGAEADVILASNNLHQVKNLFVEYHSFSNRKQKLHDLLEKLAKEGFRYYITTVWCPKVPFLEVNDYLGMDLQLNISCIRAGC